MEMHVWKVTLESEWKYIVTPNQGKTTSYKEKMDEEFTVAAPTGLKAIEIAKKVALDKERGYVDDWSNEEETIKSEPSRVVDVVGLELKETLDG